MPSKQDGRDDYRREYNRMLLDKAAEGNGIVQDRYITVSVERRSIEEARSFFARVGSDLANNMKKQGGFIPGIRPGKPTSDYLNRILNYIIFIGACGLTIVCVLPFVFNGIFGASVSFGGTSLIIVVSVVLETLKQIESLMLVRNYKGFLND